MKHEQLEDLKAKFYEGSLTEKEVADLKGILREEGDDAKLNTYLNMTEGADSFKPISREAFFETLQEKSSKRRKRNYLVAASLAAVFAIASILFFKVDNSRETVSSADIDRSVEVTRLALNAMSSRISVGMSKVEKGIDLSKPYHSLEKLNKQTLKK